MDTTGDDHGQTGLSFGAGKVTLGAKPASLRLLDALRELLWSMHDSLRTDEACVYWRATPASAEKALRRRPAGRRPPASPCRAAELR